MSNYEDVLNEIESRRLRDVCLCRISNNREFYN